jgi:hypothetical protein
MILQADINAVVLRAKLLLPETVAEAVMLKNSGYEGDYSQKMNEAQYMYLGIKFFGTNTDATDLEKQKVFQCLVDIVGLYDTITQANTVTQDDVELIYQTEASSNSFSITGSGSVTFFWGVNTFTQPLSGATSFTIPFGFSGFKTVRASFSDVDSVTAITANNNGMFGVLDLSSFNNLVAANFDNNEFTGVNFGAWIDNPDVDFSLQYNRLSIDRIGAIIDSIEGNSSSGFAGRSFNLDFNSFASRDKISVVYGLLSEKTIVVQVSFIPEAPQITVIDAASATSIGLEWLDYSDNEDFFLVERSVDQLTWLEIAELPENTTSYTDSTVSEATTYYYRLRAKANSEVTLHYSAYSNTAQVTTPSDTFPITVTGGNKQITVSWNDNETAELKWEVLRALSSEGPYVNISGDLPENTNQYIDSSLLIKTRYWYQVVVTKSNGNTTTSEIGSAETNSGSFSRSFSASFS